MNRLPYDDERLHEELEDLPPAEYEELNISKIKSQTLAADETSSKKPVPLQFDRLRILGAQVYKQLPE